MKNIQWKKNIDIVGKKYGYSRKKYLNQTDIQKKNIVEKRVKKIVKKNIQIKKNNSEMRRNIQRVQRKVYIVVKIYTEW